MDATARDWLPAVTVAVLVFAASVVDPASVAAVTELVLPSGGGPDGGADPTVPSDKLGHLTIYAALGAALARGTFGAGDLRYPVLLAAAGAFLYGGSIELIQSTLPYRSMEAADAVANGVGGTVGAATVGAARRWRAGTRGGATE